jgi:hypothetical protein
MYTESMQQQRTSAHRRCDSCACEADHETNATGERTTDGDKRDDEPTHARGRDRTAALQGCTREHIRVPHRARSACDDVGVSILVECGHFSATSESAVGRVWSLLTVHDLHATMSVCPYWSSVVTSLPRLSLPLVVHSAGSVSSIPRALRRHVGALGTNSDAPLDVNEVERIHAILPHLTHSTRVCHSGEVRQVSRCRCLGHSIYQVDSEH